MVWKSGAKFEGIYKEGIKEGKGTFVYPSKAYYTGDWKDDMKDGYGIYYFANGD